MYTEANKSMGSFRRRAGPAAHTIKEIPEAHMEPLLILWGDTPTQRTQQDVGGLKKDIGKRKGLEQREE